MDKVSKPVRQRRGRGEGSIWRRADGRWQARLDLGWVAGKRKHKDIYGRTRAEVASKLRKLATGQEEGKAPPNDRIRLDSFLATWLGEVVKPRRSHGHWRNCEGHVRLHIAPAIGRLPLARLTVADVERLINEVRGKGVAPDTVRLVHATLRAALGVANRWGLVQQNVATLVEPITVQREEVVPFSDDEVKRLLAAADEDRLGAYVKVALALGLRPGEGRGLKWDDLVLDGPHAALRVRRAFSRAEKGGEQLGPPKTARSRRTIALPDQSVTTLREHRRRQLEERLVAGPAWEEAGFVFANEVGAPLSEKTLSRWFARLWRPGDRAPPPHLRLPPHGGQPSSGPRNPSQGPDGGSRALHVPAHHGHLLTCDAGRHAGRCRGHGRGAGTSVPRAVVRQIVRQTVPRWRPLHAEMLRAPAMTR